MTRTVTPVGGPLHSLDGPLTTTHKLARSLPDGPPIISFLIYGTGIRNRSKVLKT